MTSFAPSFFHPATDASHSARAAGSRNAADWYTNDRYRFGSSFSILTGGRLPLAADQGEPVRVGLEGGVGPQVEGVVPAVPEHGRPGPPEPVPAVPLLERVAVRRRVVLGVPLRHRADEQLRGRPDVEGGD